MVQNNKVQITNSSESREKILNGVRKLAEVVGSTLGPMGKNVLIRHIDYPIPQVTKDGVTVAKKINLSDCHEDMGCQLAKQTSIKTAINAGDGTTTSVVFTYALMHAINEFLKTNPNYNVHEIRKNLEVQKNILIKALLTKLSTPVTSNDQIKNIATISANNDTTIGDLIALAYKKIGLDGIITIEPSNTATTTIEVVDGIKFNKGWMSHYFITNPAKLTCELQDVGLFITDYKITDGQTMMNILRAMKQSTKKSFLILAENIEGEALQTIIANKQQNKIDVCLVNPPYYGSRRRDYLDDLAKLTASTTFYADDSSMKITDFHPSHIGSIEKCIVKKDSTVMSLGNETDVKERLIKELRELKIQTEDKEDKDWIDARIAMITSGIAVIKLGGNSESEIYEIKDRLDDALCAVSSAIEEGFVAGGGTTYLKLSRILTVSTPEERMLKSALSSPLDTILNNCGIQFQERTAFIDTVYSEVEDKDFGFNAKSMLYEEDMINAGIIDATKVIKNVIENGVSVASMFAITEYAVVVVEDEIL